MNKVTLAITSLIRELIIMLPDEFSRFRIRMYNKKGCDIARDVSLSPNVRIRGNVKIGSGSSVAQNGSINGVDVGVVIKKNVMIAPNVVIVAFNHVHDRLDVPMSQQGFDEGVVVIDDDVWIGANVTVGKGVTIGTGAIVGANSFVNSDVPPYSIAAGVPAKFISKRRLK